MRRLIVISGAGLSVESGIRAFRVDTDSGKAMWDEYDLEEVCDIHAFNRSCYHKTHEFYNKRREDLATVEPNAAHLQIAQWYKEFPGQVINITTNVDDLLERAGIPHEDVLHVHGYLPEVVVRDALTKERTIVDVGYSQIDPNDFDWVKPNVVFFYEAAPLYNDMYHIFNTLTTQDMIIVVGCSNQVIDFNWALFPAVMAGTKMIVVNPGLKSLEIELYEERGVIPYPGKAVETFTNKHFVNLVNRHLNGAIPRFIDKP